MAPMSIRWQLLLIAVLVLGGAPPSATAQGSLRRLLFGPPCPPAPPACVQVVPTPVPLAASVKEKTPVPKEPTAHEQGPWGTLEGRVVLKGELPSPVQIVLRTDNDKKYFLKAPKELLFDSTWRIDPKTRGVANVTVYLKRPKDGILPIHPDDKIRKEAVVMETLTKDGRTVALKKGKNMFDFEMSAK